MSCKRKFIVQYIVVFQFQQNEKFMIKELRKESKAVIFLCKYNQNKLHKYERKK